MKKVYICASFGSDPTESFAKAEWYTEYGEILLFLQIIDWINLVMQFWQRLTQWHIICLNSIIKMVGLKFRAMMQMKSKLIWRFSNCTSWILK